MKDVTTTLTTPTHGRRRGRVERREEGMSYIYIYIYFFVNNAFLSHTKTNMFPAPLSNVASPSSFAAPSRASTSKPGEETADKGSHAPLSREDEN